MKVLYEVTCVLDNVTEEQARKRIFTIFPVRQPFWNAHQFCTIQGWT